LILFWRYIFVTILPGHVGVLYSWLFGGTEVTSVYGEGLAMKLPWNRIYIIETRMQISSDEIYALSREGMGVTVDLSALYSVKRESAGYLLKEVGMEYEQRVIKPLVAGTLREIVSHYDSNELYTTDFRSLANELDGALKKSQYSHLFNFNNVLLRQIKIPELIGNAIEQKLAQEQIAASYVYRLESERQAAEQKRIRALGIQNFYSIVSGALNKNLLTWRGIEATVELAQSPNSKVVIVGGGQNQMPLILGSDMQNMPPPPPVKAMTEKEAPELGLDSLPKLFPNNVVYSDGLRNSARVTKRPSSETSKKQPEQPKSAVEPAKPATPKQKTEYDRNLEGLIQAPIGSDGLAAPKPNAKEGLRKQPLTNIGKNMPEAAPYGTNAK
jgi:regulator of protease activity HflC (stomatin/prohibitin superfamily)